MLRYVDSRVMTEDGCSTLFYYCCYTNDERNARGDQDEDESEWITFDHRYTITGGVVVVSHYRVTSN